MTLKTSYQESWRAVDDYLIIWGPYSLFKQHLNNVDEQKQTMLCL
jgi:hypothetical protein